MMARTFGRERRGGVPAFDPLGPGRVRADDLRAAADAGAHRAGRSGPGRRPRAAARRAVAPCAGGGRVRADPRERLGAQLLQPGTAVDQQRLADHAGPRGARCARRGSPTGRGSRRPGAAPPRPGAAPKISWARCSRLNRPSVLEVAEPAELPGQREQERAHRSLGRSRLGRAELRGAGPDQPRPLPAGPGPVGPAGPRAVRQDQPGGVAAGAAQVAWCRRGAAQPAPRPAARPAGRARATARRRHAAASRARGCGASRSHRAGSAPASRPRSARRAGRSATGPSRHRPVACARRARRPQHGAHRARSTSPPQRRRRLLGEHADAPARGSAPSRG